MSEINKSQEHGAAIKQTFEKPGLLPSDENHKLNCIVYSMDSIKISVEHLKNFLLDDSSGESGTVIENPNELYVFQTFRAIDSLDGALKHLFDAYKSCKQVYITSYI